MKVTIISHNNAGEMVVATAGGVCYSPDGPEEVLETFRKDYFGGDRYKTANQINLIHESCFEHATYTFGIEGISRDCTHQLVRHRLASFSQQSQRYVRQDDREVYVPHRVVDTDEAEFVYYKAIDDAYNAYERLMALGIPKEDARYILPGAALSNIVVTMNARELLHFFSLRCCARAQDEIRELATEMMRQVRKMSPLLFASAGPSCVRLGYCPEHKGCGKAPTMGELRYAWASSEGSR